MVEQRPDAGSASAQLSDAMGTAANACCPRCGYATSGDLASREICPESGLAAPARPALRRRKLHRLVLARGLQVSIVQGVATLGLALLDGDDYGYPATTPGLVASIAIIMSSLIAWCILSIAAYNRPNVFRGRCRRLCHGRRWRRSRDRSCGATTRYDDAAMIEKEVKLALLVTVCTCRCKR